MASASIRSRRRRTGVNSSGCWGRSSFPSVYLIAISHDEAAESRILVAPSFRRLKADARSLSGSVNHQSQQWVSISSVTCECVDYLVPERRIEVIGNGEEAPVAAGNPFFALFLVRSEPSNRRASVGDDNLLANGYPLQQPGEMGLCLVYAHCAHHDNMDLVSCLVKPLHSQVFTGVRLPAVGAAGGGRSRSKK